MIGKTLRERYQIKALLGQGGMSAVYLAFDSRLRRDAALKMIHPHLAGREDFLARFEQEAAVVARLQHPNIVQVYDFDHEGDAFFMVMELVRGRSLAARLEDLARQGERMPMAEALRLLGRVCGAVAYAHSRNVIHRDLKPDNILLSEQGEPILTDFGTAKIVGVDRTKAGVLVGTVAYMAPEQVQSQRPDARTDVYALGVILYQLLTGVLPFDDDSVMSTMRRIVRDPLPPARRLNPAIPDDLNGVLEKSLAKAREERYPSAAELGAALEQVRSRLESDRPVRPRADETVIEAPAVPFAPPREAPAARGEKVQAAAPRVPAAGPPPAREKAAAPARRHWPLVALIGVPVALGCVALVGGALILRALLPAAIPETGLPSAEGMVKVPEGTYALGSTADANHIASRPVDLPAFWIDRHEVTNADYAAFVEQTGASLPYGWAEGRYPPGEEQHPVRGVFAGDAAAYCESLGKRLPTEAEWEAAARGPDGRLYPWGDEAGQVTLDPANTYSVGSVAENQSVFGVYDMAGNAWEWVRDPYAPVEPGLQVLRGGSYNYPQDMAYRLAVDPGVATAIVDAGFRCAAAEVEGGQ